MVPGLVFEYRGFRPPTTGLIGVHLITSSVHSYLRSISTAGVAPSLFLLSIHHVREISRIYNIVLVFE
jgi:hypothetical protein